MEKMRLDRYLSEVLGVSRAQIAHLIDKKMVLVNGAVAKKSEIVGKGDDIKIAESNASNSPLGLHSVDLANFGEQQTQSLVISPKFTKNHESQTENPSVVDSALIAQNLINLKLCEAPENSPASWCKKSDSRLQKCNRRFFARSGESEALPLKAKSGSFWRVGGAGRGVQPFCEKEKSEMNENSVRVAESSLNSADSQNLPQIQRIYEDNDILVLNKPPFLATHGAPSLKEPSLVDWLKAHKIQRSTISGELREGIVHRLDKQTSGALVVAKNNDAHNALGAQLADKTMGRLYLAIIDLPLKEDIEIECYLARNPKNRLKISKVDIRKYKKSAQSNLNSCEAPETRPLRGAKNQNQASSSGKADFLLEAEKRGSPPKSEKAAAFWEHNKKELGGAGRGVQPFLRKRKNSNKNAESIKNQFVDDCFARLANPTDCHADSANLLAMTKNKDFAESRLDSALPKFARYSKSKFYKLLPSKDGKKELILARLFTGRTHQIRAHLESINRHIVGDELYGYKRGKGENERVMLHAYLLELTHPKSINFAESRVGNSPLGLHSADLANFGEQQTQSLVVSPKFAKNHESQTENPSVVDSARGAESSEKIKSKKPFKSFYSVWLLPKVESPLPLNPNLPNNADSTKSQNLVNLNSCEAPKSRPLRGAKNREQGRSSASADFLLEAEKRGSPPKSEKAELFGAQGERGGGCSPFCEKEKSEIVGVRVAESSADSADSQNLKSGLPLATSCARNDEFILDSANPKLRFIAPLFDDMKDYLAKNFDMEKVYEILHDLPARAF